MFGQSILFLVALFSLSAQAARDVSISLDGSQSTLVLTNTSTVSVNYDITCHRADAGGTVLVLAGQTLAPNASVKHTASLPDSGLCAASAAPQSTFTDINGKPYYLCGGANTYANAGNACGTGNSFCFPDVSGYVGACSCSSFWLKNDGAVQFQPSCGSYGAVTGGFQVAVGSSGSGNVKKNSVVSCAWFGFATEVAVASTAGAVCCSSPIPGSLCKVTINTTNPSAFLSSPSFMGGAAF